MKRYLLSAVLLLLIPSIAAAQAPGAPPTLDGPPAPAETEPDTDATEPASAPEGEEGADMLLPLLPTSGTSNDVVSLAANNPNFTTFAEALVASGLADKLRSGGPYTIFAPTNKAFKNLPKGTLTELLKPDNREKLLCILRYHIVPGSRSTAELGNGPIETEYGLEAEITAVDGQYTIDGAALVETDLQASNGMIHGIDSVIAPEK